MHFTAEGAGHHLFVFTPPLPLAEEGGEEDEELGNGGRSRCRNVFLFGLSYRHFIFTSFLLG